MSEPESKKLEEARNAFVDALADERASGRGQQHSTNDLARALSVLAEEAPPVKEPRCTCGSDWPDATPTHFAPCPLAAPAPKQRGVEEILGELLLMWADKPRTVALLWNIQTAYREERAASEEDRAAMLSTYGEIQTLGRENDILRESVEKALSILTPHVNSRRPCSCAVCKAVNVLEGKGEGTEDREGSE